MTSWVGLGLACAALLQAGAAPRLPAGLSGFQSYGKREGLSNVSATALAQDPEGFLWAGTDHGLFRLEGGHFRAFDLGDGLPSTMVTGLGAGVRRGLWVLTNQGLVFWNGHAFQAPSSLGLNGADSLQGVALNQGGVLLQDPTAQMNHLSLDGEPFQRLEGLPWAGICTAGTCAPDRDLLALAFGRELWLRECGAWRHRDLSAAFASDLTALWIDAQGGILLRSPEGLGRLATLEAPLQKLAAPAGLSAGDYPGLGVDGEGRIWINTAGGVVWLKDDRSGFIGEHEGLPQGGAYVLRVDRQGLLWIGGEGVHRLLGEGRWTGYTMRQGIPSALVWSVACTRSGRTWVGTTGGLAVAEAAGWKLLPATRSSQVLGLEEDADGNLWVGHTPAKGRPEILSVVPAGQVTPIPVPLKVTPSPTRVRSIHCEGTTVWLGTSMGGLLKARRTGTTLSALERVPIGTWPTKMIINLVKGDGSGGLWVGSAKGLAHWDGRDWAILDKASGLADDQIPTLAALPGQAAWAVTIDPTTLFRVQRSGSRLVVEETLTAPNPLVSQPILALALRPGGILWAGTSTGLLRWDGRRLLRFGKEAGFPGEDCSQNAMTFGPDGDLWVGLSVGLVHGRLEGALADQSPPAMVILTARRGDGQSILEPTSAREVPWRDRALSFTYCPRGSQQGDEVSYQVRLKGLEDDWRSTAIPEARYPSLPPGAYTFEVRSVTWCGELGPAQSLAVHVQAPWWLRPPALAGLFLFLVAGGVLTVRWRTTLLRQRNALLEGLVQERTRALSEANHALEEASLVDPLTTLRNRRFLEFSVPPDALGAQRSYLESNKAGRDPRLEKEALLFFLLDLDHFKDVNDRYGHPAGDAVLVQFSEVLKGVTRASDSLIRWGGEEFLLVSKRARPQDAIPIAETLLAAARAKAYLLPSGETIRITCSFGLVAFPLHPGHPELGTWTQAIDLADQCLYAAKRSGRDRWVAAFIQPEAPAAPFEGKEGWQVGWAVAQGLMKAESSGGEVLWNG